MRHEAFVEKWQKRGVSFDLPASPALDDEENFLKAPGIVDWIEYYGPDGLIEREGRPEIIIAAESFHAAAVSGPSFWLRDYRIEPVEMRDTCTSFEQLWQEDEATVALLHEAALRPSTDVHSVYGIEQLNNVQKYLTYRAYHHVHSGNLPVGLRDFTTSLRLSSQIYESCPSLVGSLIELAGLDIAINAIWVSLESGDWDKESLDRLEAECRRIRLTQDFPKRLIRMIAIEDKDMRSQPYEDERDPRLAQKLESRIQLHLVTSHSMLVDNLLWDKQGDRLTTELTQQSSLNLEEAVIKWRMQPDWRRSLTGITVRNLGKWTDRTLELQQLYEFAIVACQLKKFHLEHGAYPEFIDELRTGEIRDLFTDASYATYKRLDADNFELISIGSDRTDDSGNKEDDLVWTTVLPTPKPPEPIDPETAKIIERLLKQM